MNLNNQITKDLHVSYQDLVKEIQNLMAPAIEVVNEKEIKRVTKILKNTKRYIERQVMYELNNDDHSNYSDDNDFSNFWEDNNEDSTKNDECSQNYHDEARIEYPKYSNLDKIKNINFVSRFEKGDLLVANTEL